MKNIITKEINKSNKCTGDIICKELDGNLILYSHVKEDIGKHLGELIGKFTAHNLYILSDEQIKELDYLLDTKDNKIHRALRINSGGNIAIDLTNKIVVNQSYCKKIILTTDQDLIKDGVQAIDKEFLEWFVKNPNHDYVEVYNDKKVGYEYEHYSIIIPNEDKQVEKKVEELDVEETAKIKFDLFQKENPNIPKKDIQPFKLGFIMGARWQKEKSYGEKDIIDLIQFLSMNQSFNDYSSVSKETAKSFLEQFKKK